jgi:4'-phosphopantetheinyl transferase
METNLMRKSNHIITFTRKETKHKAQLLIIQNQSTSSQKLSQSLSPQEHKQYSNFPSQERKNSFLLGRYCAKNALSNFCNIEKLSNIHISNGVFGNPIINHKDIQNVQISISHSNNIAAAIAFEESHPTAIDLEIIDKAKSKDIQSQLTSHEISLALGIAWTAKESLSKILKTGFTLPLHILEINSITSNSNQTFTSTYANFTQYKTISYLQENIIYSITFPKNSNIEMKIEQNECL